MMALNRQRGGDGAVLREGDPGTLRPVIEPGILALQPRLEAFGVLAQVMK